MTAQQKAQAAYENTLERLRSDPEAFADFVIGEVPELAATACFQMRRHNSPFIWPTFLRPLETAIQDEAMRQYNLTLEEGDD